MCVGSLDHLAIVNLSEVCHVWRKKEILFMSTQLDLLSFVKVILSGLFVLLFLVDFPF